MIKIKNYKKIILLSIAILFVAILGAATIVLNENIKVILSHLQTLLDGNFPEGVYIAILSLRTLLIFFTYTIFVVLGGTVFGAGYGFMYSMLGILISANIAFFIGRMLGQDNIKKLMGKRFTKLNSTIEKYGLRVILLMRLSCLLPFDSLNYIAGATNMSYKDFIIGTSIGVIPEIFVLSFLGENLKDIYSLKFISAIILLILMIIIPILYNNRYKNKKSDK